MSLGNDGSAFVEALVNRSGDDGDKYEVKDRMFYSMLLYVFISATCVDILYCSILFLPVCIKVLLVTSSFMSPAESKSWTNTNRVRMFGEH